MIRVEHLTKRFGKTSAANDVSFTVNQGEVFAFLGPNGGGKTTTLKCLVGLNIPTAGRIEVNGLDILRYPRESRQCISYLPQRVVFPENQTAREVMEFYCRLRNLPMEQALMALRQADLEKAAERLVSEFSGGMVQRLGLAVVALPDAPVLLLDEPTANLDPQGVKRFREFILQQKENGRTVIFSTHLLHEAEQLADRVGIFVGGRLAAQESTETLRLAYLAAHSLEDMYIQYVEAHEHGAS
jgi:ABC-type multidrug transport system ATPase subunit